MTILLDGKKFALKITEELKSKTALLEKKPKLAVIIIGEDPASLIYVKNKKLKADEIGYDSVVIPLPSDVSEDNVIEQIHILNDDENINAIMVQLPVPEHLSRKRILEAVSPIKDVDGFTSYNFGRMSLGYDCYAKACTPKGIIKLLDEYKIEIEGKNAVVIGRSSIVGKPVACLLQQRNATVTVIHSKSKNAEIYLKNADIIVSAAGIPGLIGGSLVKEGAVIVDVGINRTEKGLCGDVIFDEVAPVSSYITPVPGGIGPVTVAMLMENTFELYLLQQSLKI